MPKFLKNRLISPRVGLFNPSNSAEINYRALVVRTSLVIPQSPAPSRVGNVVIIGGETAAVSEVIPNPLASSGTAVLGSAGSYTLTVNSVTYSINDSWVDTTSGQVTNTDLWLLASDTTLLTNDHTLALGYLPAIPAGSVLNPILWTKGQPAPIDSVDLAEMSTFERYIYVAAAKDNIDLATILNNIYDNIDNFSVVVLTKSISDMFLSATNLPEVTLPTFLTQDSNLTVPNGFTSQVNLGVFLDTDFDGKVLAAITAMAQRDIAAPTPTNQLIFNNYSGEVNKNNADMLAGSYFSFYFKTKQQTYPFSLFCGGRQLYTILYEMHAIEAIMDNLAALTAKGGTLIEHIPLAEVAVLTALEPYLPKLISMPSIQVTQVDKLTQSDINNGILRIGEISLNFSGEHRLSFVRIVVGI